MEKYPITARSLEPYYHIDGDQFERQYKDHLSDYRTWLDKGHAEDWLIFPDNIGDSKKQLLARSRYLLYKSCNKWTEKQKERAKILFAQYPDLREAYSLAHSLRMIFAKNSTKDGARLALARWYNKVDLSKFRSFNVISATIYEHYNEVLNFFVNRSTNAFAEAFNAKVKAFRAQLRGVTDIKFFLFRLITIYA